MIRQKVVVIHAVVAIHGGDGQNVGLEVLLGGMTLMCVHRIAVETLDSEPQM